MKSTIAVGALLFSSLAVSDLLAQAQFFWGNNLPASPTGPQVRAPVYGVDPNNPTEIRRGNTALGLPAGTQTYGGPLLAGTGFTVAIYVGNDPASTMANNTPPTMGTSAFRTGGGAGLIFTLTATDETRPNGTVDVHYQFRAWDNDGGTVASWAQLMAAGGSIAGGTSDVFVFNAPIGGGGVPPPLTSEIRSFQLTVVPEPSLIALGALGLGALLLLRRRK